MPGLSIRRLASRMFSRKSPRMASSRYRPRMRAEVLEDRITPVGNIVLYDATMVSTSGQALTSISVGQQVDVEADFSTVGLPSNASYRIGYTVNGFTYYSNYLTFGAGGSGTQYWYEYWGFFIASSGTNQVSVTADPDHSVAESSYADNTMNFTFTASAPAVSYTSYTVAQIRNAYGINSIPNFGSAVADGSGQTIAIVDVYNDPTVFTDLDSFDQAMSLTTTSTETLYQQYGAASSFLSVYNQDGTNITSDIADSGEDGVPEQNPSGDGEGETTLDVQWAHAMAPGAHIDLVETTGTGNYGGFFTGAAAAAQLPGVTVVSMSYIYFEGDWSSSNGGGELALDSSTFVTPSGHPGITFLASAGDGGTPGGYPAFSPNVVAVGGTQLSINNNEYAGETGWSFPTPVTINNGSSAYSQTGSWTSQSGGYSGTYSTAPGGNNSSATWTASIPSSLQGWLGGTELSTTWVPNAANATDATYKIYDGSATTGTLLGTVAVDQTKAPVGTSVGDSQFQELGDYYSTSGTLTVVLSANGANGTVSADALGIAPAWATGGGQSMYESEPSYQLGVQSSGYRTTPDVSFDGSGNSGVTIYQNGYFYFDNYGTSLSAPCWAGLIAIADQGIVADGGTPLNSPTNQQQTLQLLYQLPSRDFNDITSGYNGLSAGTGYDELTGRGSPIANLLIPDLVSLASLSLSESTVSIAPTSIQSGNTATVTLTARESNGQQEAQGGLDIVFGLGAGSASGTFSNVTDNGNGTYTATFTGTTTGTVVITATIDGSAVTSTLPTITVTSSPQITTPSTTFNFPVNSTSSYTIDATGFPTPSFSESGALPPNVTFTDNGNGTVTIAGMPPLGSEQSDPITVTASNSDGTSQVSYTIDVIKANQTVTWNNTIGTVTYGVSPITLSATSSSGLPVVYSVVSGPGSISGNQLTVLGVGSIVIQASQDGNTDYNPASVQQTATVTPATLTVTGITANNKVYDQSTTATLNTSSANLVGVFSGDSVSLITTGAVGTFASPNVGSGTSVTVSGLTLGGAQAGDYTLTQPTTSANITPATLTVTGVTANNKVYDDTITASLNTGRAALNGVFSGDSVTLNTSGAVGTFASKDVGSGISVTVSGLTLGGTQAGDYTLTQPTTSANITPATLTVTGVTASSKVYDDTTIATLSTTGASLVGVFTDDTVTLVTSEATGTFSSKDVGNSIAVAVGGLTLGGAQASDYSLTQPSTSANITPATLTVTGVTASSKVYDDTTIATLSTTGASVVGVFTDDTVTLVTSGATGTFSSKDVGNSIAVTVSGLTLGGAQANDYALTQPTTSGNITPAPLTVTDVTANNKVYDHTTIATLSATGASLVGVFTGDTVSLVTTGSTGTFSSSNVGSSIAVTVSGLSLAGTQAGDYTLTQPTTSANITPATLTVTGVTANSKVYDDTTTASLNTGSAALNGVFSGDSVTLNTSAAVGTFASKDVGSEISVAVGGLTLSGAQTGDYTLTQPTTSANITPATLTVTGVTASNKVYDRTTTATLSTTGASLVGVFTGDTVTLVTSGATGAFSSSNVGNSISVAVSGLTLGGAQANDYSLTQPTLSANITPFRLTVTGITANDKVYDHTTTATLSTTGASLVGVFTGDTVSLVTTGSTATFSSSNVGSSLPVAVSGLTLGGTQAGDYTLTQPAPTANITPAILTVTGVTVNNKVYDQTTIATLSTTGASLVGVFTGDTVSLVTTGSTATFSSSNVGSSLPVAVSGLTLGGAQAGDYTLTQPTTSGNITPATLTVTGVTANSKVYDGTTTATLSTTGASLLGVFTGDTVTLVTSGATGTFASSDVGNGIAVPVSGLSLTGTQAGDYSLTQPSTSANITPATLTVTPGNTSRPYGQPNPSFSATITGLVDGGPASVVSGSAALTTTATAASGVGLYPITATLGTLAAANYTFTFLPGALTVTPATLTITPTAGQSKVYEAAVPVLTYTLSGLVNKGPTSTVSGLLGTTATAGSSVGTYAFTLGTLTVGHNYTLQLAANAPTFAVTPVAQPILIGGLPNGTVQVDTESNGTYTLQETLQPFGNIPTDVRTAVGDVNGDGIPDYIFAIGPSPTDSTGAAIPATTTEFKVMVLSGAPGNPVLIQPFDPFLPNPGGSPFTAGGFVSAGDFLNNGRDQIVVSPDQQGGPRIAIYDMDGAATAGPQAATPVGVNTTEINPGSGLTRINNFLSVNANFRGGARTAVGDLNGDGVPDLAIAAGFGGGPAVLVINGTKVPTTSGFTASDDLIGDFFAFNSTLRDGAYLAIGDVLGNGQQDLILGPGAGGPAEVEVLSGAQIVNEGAVAAIANPVANFVPTGLGPDGSGMRVAVAATGVGDDVNVVVGAGRNMPGVVKVYPGSGFTSGSTSEPTGGQLISPFGGGPLTDGIFVG